MQQPTHATARFLRFTVWVLLMLAGFLIATEFAPHRVAVIPAIFMVLFVPMVLMPIHKRPDQDS